MRIGSRALQNHGTDDVDAPSSGGSGSLYLALGVVPTLPPAEECGTLAVAAAGAAGRALLGANKAKSNPQCRELLEDVFRQCNLRFDRGLFCRGNRDDRRLGRGG